MNELDPMFREITEHDCPTRYMDETQVMPAIPATMKDRYDFHVEPDPYKTQVGGEHYKKYAIQPTEYIIKNKLNFCEGNVIKYVTRYKDKNGIEDLKKARHYLDILIAEMQSEDASTRREF